MPPKLEGVVFDPVTRRRFGSLAVTLLAGAAAAGACARSDGSPAGFEQVELDGWGGPRLQAYFHRADGWDESWPVVIVLHGANRNVDYTASTWLPLAGQMQVMPVIPHFTEHRFRGDRYALGGIRRGSMGSKSAFNAIEPLFDIVRDVTGSRSQRYSLFGHSAGAQFVERFLLFNPAARVDRSVMSMAGYYTLPDTRLPWPYGLAQVAIGEDSFARLLARDCMVVLGVEDNDPRDERLRRTSLARLQGAHRLERGLNFFSRATRFAEINGLPMNWQLRVLSDVDHDSRAAAIASAEWLANGA